jgi:hypothetical protein
VQILAPQAVFYYIEGRFLTSSENPNRLETILFGTKELRSHALSEQRYLRRTPS